MQLRIFTEPQQGADYGRLLAVARAAEELGFGAFFRSDHYLKMQGTTGLPGPTDAWITLAGLARETSRIRLGTLMSPVTFRYPGPLAISVAQVDEMSGGRVELGLGTGWFGDEHTAYGIPFPPMTDRFAMLEEQLAIITGLWETPEGETFTFQGTHYPVADSPALPKPVQRPRPPVIIGGEREAIEFPDELFRLGVFAQGRPATPRATIIDTVSQIGESAGSVKRSMTLSVALNVAATQMSAR